MNTIAVLASTRGTDLQAIIDATEAGSLDAQVVVVVSNKECPALERARSHGIPAVRIDAKGKEREAYDREVAAVIDSYHAGLILCIGYMRILSPWFVSTYRNRVMNIHPSLLPSFPGLHVQKKAIEYGARFSGCTVHFVDEGVDTGPIIIQAVAPVLNDDTEETLSARILKEEHRIYPYAIKLFAEGRLEVKGRRVIVKDHPRAEGALENPPVLPK